VVGGGGGDTLLEGDEGLFGCGWGLKFGVTMRRWG
jgi:hypothetical protein